MKSIGRRQFVQSTLIAGLVLPIQASPADATGNRADRPEGNQPASSIQSSAQPGKGQKIALVTGATRGLGLAIVRQLGAMGMYVLLGARNLKSGEALAAGFRAEGLEIHALELDVDDAGTAQRAARLIEEKFGRLDILINNAGIFSADKDGLPSVAEFQTVERILKTNFMGAVIVTQYMLPLVRKAPKGRIVNVSSSVGSLHGNAADWSDTSGEFMWLGYNASKAAMNMLTIQLAYELRNTPIKVNSICPGYVQTDMNEGRGALTAAEAAKLPIRYALLGDEGPSGGFFTAEGPVAW